MLARLKQGGTVADAIEALMIDVTCGTRLSRMPGSCGRAFQATGAESCGLGVQAAGLCRATLDALGDFI